MHLTRYHQLSVHLASHVQSGRFSGRDIIVLSAKWAELSLRDESVSKHELSLQRGVMASLQGGSMWNPTSRFGLHIVHSEAYIIVTLVDGREIDVPGYLKIKRKPLKSC